MAICNLETTPYLHPPCIFMEVFKRRRFFHKTDALIMIMKLILLIKNLHSKGLERNIGNEGAKNPKKKFI
jgi:hypothetical protein